MLLIIGRALNMLKSQIAAQGRAFEATGGFSERLTKRRLEARNQAPGESPPECTECGSLMRLRKSAKGEFWGCSGYPECRGFKPR